MLPVIKHRHGDELLGISLAFPTQMLHQNPRDLTTNYKKIAHPTPTLSLSGFSSASQKGTCYFFLL